MDTFFIQICVLVRRICAQPWRIYLLVMGRIPLERQKMICVIDIIILSTSRLQSTDSCRITPKSQSYLQKHGIIEDLITFLWSKLSLWHQSHDLLPSSMWNQSQWCSDWQLEAILVIIILQSRFLGSLPLLTPDLIQEAHRRWEVIAS